MPTSSFNKFQDFVEQLGKGVHDFSTHTFKVALTNSAPLNTYDELADVTQISATGGYTAGAGGGYSVTCSWAETSGTAKLTITDKVITASGGNVGPFRYAVLYNDTSTGDKLVGYFDYGSALTLADTETLTLNFDDAAGVFTVT